MSTAMRAVARVTTAVAALLLVVLSLGFAGTAYAGPDDNNKGGRSDTSGDGGAGATAVGPTGSNGSGATKGNGPGSNAKSPADHKTVGNAGTSGDAGEPQPLSNADQNTGGANGKCPGGPYCSTRDGSPSENGKGDGVATGKPCAGCVGKADNKNPKGQYPNGATDGNMKNGKGNAGYECDRNQGIGQTNPAHTGCQGGTTPPPPPGGETCPDGSPLPPSGDVEDCPTPPGGETCPDGSPLPPSGDVEDCPTPPGGETCPDGSPLPPSGDVEDCPTPPGGETCPDGSPLPPSGDVEDCPNGGGVTPPGPGGEEKPEAPRPPTVAGVEQFAGPSAQQGAPAPAAVGPSGVLPSTGATTLMNGLALAGLGLVLAGAATLLHRRFVS